MRTRIFLAVLAASLGGAALAADELPPYAGSHDDASYGDMPHVTVTVQGLPGGAALAGGAARDDTTYPAASAPAQAPAPSSAPARVACDCRR